MSAIELRCPNTHAKLLGRLITTDRSSAEGSKVRIEIACPECKRELRRAGKPATIVLVTFDGMGRVVNHKVKPVKP